jgi:hypothetical protein
MATFRSKARLVEILGEHLIKDNTVGLLELVKNAYDADATTVEISLENLDYPPKTIIMVRDNGDGMTLATVEGPWLEPAHGGKEIQKENQTRSRRGRLPLGEKGVGRFAAHKLGKYLTLVTRHSKSDKEVVLEIDWTPFESHDAYLEEIVLEPKERKPEIFSGSSHGTCLIMRDARERWRDEDLRRLQASLQKLKSPTKGAVDFEVKLHCPEFPQFQNLDPVDLLDKAHFSLAGIVDEDGMIEFDFAVELQLVGWRHVTRDTVAKLEGGSLRVDLIQIRYLAWAFDIHPMQILSEIDWGKQPEKLICFPIKEPQPVESYGNRK